MRRIGKRGKINAKANKKCKADLLARSIVRCEMCGSGTMLSIAHKKKRRDYYSDPEGLSRWGEYLLLCQLCHQSIEFDKEKTKKVFERLR